MTLRQILITEMLKCEWSASLESEKNTEIKEQIIILRVERGGKWKHNLSHPTSDIIIILS